MIMSDEEHRARTARDLEWQRLMANDMAVIARLRAALESANANVMEGARLVEQMSTEAAEARTAAEWLNGENKKLIETCCLLFDSIAFGIGNVQLEPNLAATEAGRAIKAVLQAARDTMEVYDVDDGFPSGMELSPSDDLFNSLSHPVILGMLAAWAVKEG